MSASEWWLLTILLLTHVEAQPKWNEADRQFLYRMVNELSVTQDAMPTPGEQKWLLSIKREVDRNARGAKQ